MATEQGDMSAPRRQAASSSTGEDRIDPVAEDASSEPKGSGRSPRSRSTAPANGRRRSTPPRVRARADGSDDPATAEVTGIVGDASAQVSRSGEDVRKRGWFWHWNSIVTQYAPLLGLKGVGLLNSYTVWTDRREESPHRGYAFPSQQSEADFYGEDRAELITINKILVALDLIEIRKEMVLRVDAQGRRWKVPHNLYRVKDHGDDVNLTTGDVMRVADLADRDRAVYRYLRRVFSPRFSPIDHANVWHQILEDVRPTPVWQRLAAKTEKEERKASERTKAGHAARKGSTSSTTASASPDGSEVSEVGTPVFSLPVDGDTAASEMTGVDSNASMANDSDTGAVMVREAQDQTSVAPVNIGSETSDGTSVASTNRGSARKRPSTVGPVNTGDATFVAPTNTTYHQSKTTTTEVDEHDEMIVGREERPSVGDRFGASQGPDGSRDEAITYQRFAEANDRQPTMAERRHLRQLADFASPIVESPETTGWSLVSSAIEEAVSAGSSFVAPKRIREILARWSRDGVPAEYAGTVSPVATSSRRERGPVTGAKATGHNEPATRTTTASETSELMLPNGRSAIDVWASVMRELTVTLGPAQAEPLLAGTGIATYDAGAVTIRVRDLAQAEALTVTHAAPLGRALRAQLRRPVRLETVLADEAIDPGTVDATPSPAPVPARRARAPRPMPPVTMGAIPVFTVERCGLTNRQLWSMALGDLREGGVIPSTDIDAWLRDAALLAVEPESGDGAVTILLGVPHVLAQRRVEGRFRGVIAGALARLLGDEAMDLALEVAIIRDWQAQQSA